MGKKISDLAFSAHYSIVREERSQSKLLTRSVICENMDWRSAMNEIERIYEREEISPKYIGNWIDYINGIAFLDNGITQIRYYILYQK